MPKPPTVQTTEVVADPANDRRHRRRFSGDYKTRILAQVDACTGRGEVAALLRRESLYSSHLTEWRKQLRAHGDAALEPKAPGRKPAQDERDRAHEKLAREKAKLERELLIARKLIELAGVPERADRRGWPSWWSSFLMDGMTSPSENLIEVSRGADLVV